MPTKQIMVGLATLCILAGSATAQDANCENSQTQSELLRCEQSRYQEADKALNEYWSLAIAGVADEEDEEPSLKKALLEAQRAWISYRDMHCKVVGFQARGGSLEPAIVTGCLAHLTNYRVEELKTFVDVMKGN